MRKVSKREAGTFPDRNERTKYIIFHEIKYIYSNDIICTSTSREVCDYILK